MANITGSFNIVLPLPHVSEQGSEGASIHQGSTNIQLKAVTTVQSGSVGAQVINGIITTSLPRIVSALNASGSLIQGVLSVALKAIKFTGSLAQKHTGTLAISLPKVRAAIQGVLVHEATIHGTISCVLKRVRAIGTGYDLPINIPGTIKQLSAPSRAGSSVLFVFYGPPNRAIVWSVQTGQGTVTGLTSFTNKFGVAYGRYDPGTYIGPAEVSVEYGA